MTFRGREFRVAKGTTHPEYSFDTFTKEEAEIREKYWNVGPGEVVVDVGASYGAYTLTAAASGAGVVVAFEPEPTVFVDLVRNIGLNGYTETVWPVCVAASSDHVTVDMREYAKHWPAQTISGRYPAVALDIWWPFERMDWMKVDVEGLEEKVLLGTMACIRGYKPKLLIECHDFMDPQISTRVKALLPEYKWETIPRGECVTLYGEWA